MKKKKIIVTPWKLEDCLTTDELLFEFLIDVLNENDPQLLMKTISEVIRIKRARDKKAKRKGVKVAKIKASKIVSKNNTIDMPTFFHFLHLCDTALNSKLKTA